MNWETLKKSLDKLDKQRAEIVAKMSQIEADVMARNGITGPGTFYAEGFKFTIPGSYVHEGGITETTPFPDVLFPVKREFSRSAYLALAKVHHLEEWFEANVRIKAGKPRVEKADG